MQKWKMIEMEVKYVFGKDVEIQHIPRSHIVNFRIEHINLSKDLLSKLTSSSTIQDIYISPRSNWKDKAWMECYASGKKEDKREIREVL